ncbi:MAG TPA: orotidine-5'-phosphate decarboxylase, partial [Solirubrobacteraceae bacterium]|nr:orotidine-5'-phosphate decarboxylase [Solirubrobacteraceae bacterium]
MAERESQVVLGLDPDPSSLWPVEAGSLEAGGPLGPVAAAVLGHCRALMDATAPACVAVKLQLARFELLGADGRLVMAELIAHARRSGLLVIADGKRGDIDVTARAYADALIAGSETPFGRLEGLGADLVTVNPLMGADAVAPFVTAARAAGAGVLVLVRTSNPGAADVEELALEGGGSVWERLAVMVDELGRAGVGQQGISDVGAVIGATAPGHLPRARELMANATFLLPGVGAQGGRVEDLAAAFAPGRAGGLVSSSRGIAEAHRSGGAEPQIAARAEAERLREAAWR